MKDKIMLVPDNERYEPNAILVLYAKFRIGFLDVELNVIPSRSVLTNGRKRRQAERKHPELTKKWLCVMNIGRLGWCWASTDDIEKAKVLFQHAVKQLKYGEDVEFKDFATQQKPIRVSHRGVEFIW